MPIVVRQRACSQTVTDQALQAGYSPLQARIIAGRLAHGGDSQVQDVEKIEGQLKDLDGPGSLPDIGVAATSIAKAIMNPARAIAIVTDHDCDGATSHAVIREALLDYFHVPKKRVISLITHRLQEGYGVSDKFVDRMLEVCPQGTLAITADQGSADEARIARLYAERRIETVVTDHHGIPEAGPPESAIACVNPVREDSHFPDPFIAGVAVAWLTMCAVRRELMTHEALPATAPSMAPLLDLVALGTCADAVSMGRSRNNRIYLRAGLQRMNASPGRLAWESFRQIMGKEGLFTTKDVSHGMAPRINARGRLGDALTAVKFLRCTRIQDALRLGALLDGENQARKAIQQSMTADAMEMGALQTEAGRAAICAHFIDGHSGVHGIVASRLVETFGRPVCCLSPKQGVPGVVTGSLRSVPEINIREALVAVGKAHPGLLISAGGHAGAAGCALKEADIEVFRDAFCEAVEAQADPSTFQATVWTDGSLGGLQSMATLEELQKLEPYGREFEAPTFEDTFTVRQARVVGDGTHLKITLENQDGALLGGIWFRAQEAGAEPGAAVGDTIRAVYELALNRFRGKVSLDVVVVSADIV